MFDTWKQYVGLHCNGYTATPISDYINNLVFQELLLERDYFRKDSDETVGSWPTGQSRLYRGNWRTSRNDSKLTVTIKTKSTLTKKMRLRVWGYMKSEYMYMLSNGSLTLKYKTYTIKLLDNALEAWKELILDEKCGI